MFKPKTHYVNGKLKWLLHNLHKSPKFWITKMKRKNIVYLIAIKTHEKRINLWVLVEGGNQILKSVVFVKLSDWIEKSANIFSF